MPGSITAQILKKPPLELALRATLSFGCALWLSTQTGAPVLERLLPFYEQAVHALDDHYRIELALTRRDGHNAIGSDLVLLGRAAVTRPMVVLGDAHPVVLVPGQTLQSSTAIGIFMQPAVLILGLLLAWPVRSVREACVRGSVGAVLLALWLLAGIPLSLWIYFQTVPLQAFAAHELFLSVVAGKFLLNGGSAVIGAGLAACAIAAGHRMLVRQPRQ